ncbi:MAG: hypothetical protein PHE53_06500 [Thermoguttaceae bacterium]|nr:hypothetical protein [Thermoguttaceae bacterium]
MSRLGKNYQQGNFHRDSRGFVVLCSFACFLSVGPFPANATAVTPPASASQEASEIESATKSIPQVLEPLTVEPQASEPANTEPSTSVQPLRFSPMVTESPSFADSDLARLLKWYPDFSQTVPLAPSLMRQVGQMLQSGDAAQVAWAKEVVPLLEAYLLEPDGTKLDALRQWWESQYRMTMNFGGATGPSANTATTTAGSKTIRRVRTLGGIRSVTVEVPVVSKPSSVKTLSAAQRELLDAIGRRFPMWEGAVAGDELCTRLVPMLERFEWDMASVAEKELLDGITTMRGSKNAEVKERGERLATVYLAPNFRAMITVQLLQMLVPTRRIVRSPLTLQTPGGTIQGASLTESELKVRLLPDENQARLLFEMTGDLLSLTSAQRFGNLYAAATQSEFRAWKELQISESGNKILATQAEIRKNRFLPDSIRSTFPSMPEIQPSPLPLSQLPFTRELNQTIQQDRNAMLEEACHFLDEEGERRIGTVRQRVEDRLLNPLTDMGLGPVVQSASSTDTQANFSLNIRTPQQCGAYASVPTGHHSNALIALQAHESALNNLVEQIGLDGTTSSLFELQNRIAVRFNSPELLLAEAEDGRFVITFPETDSLRLQCREGAFQLTLRIAELIDLDEGSIWKNLEVRAVYRIEMEPQCIRLVRTEPIQLLGRNIGGESQLRLRAIFGRIFSREGYSDILPSEIFSLETLRSLQFLSAQVENGWLTLELGTKSMPSK